MKKFIPILICITLAVCVFSACSKNNENETTVSPISTTETITTDSAIITEADAVNLIQSYSSKELGLTDEEKEKCSFMVSASGEKIDNDYYVKVIAAVKTENTDDDGKTTFVLDNKGEYYIRYDGKQILSLDTETGEYSEMKVKAVPTTNNND